MKLRDHRKVHFLSLCAVLLAVSVYFQSNKSFNIAKAAGNIPFSTGYYLNLSGGGADINGTVNHYDGEADCNPTRGVCYAREKQTRTEYTNGTVEKYVCDGKVLNCDAEHSENTVVYGPKYAQAQYIFEANDPLVECNQTVQLKVTDSDRNIKGYMVWYSGNCSRTVLASQHEIITPTPPAVGGSVVFDTSPTPTTRPNVSLSFDRVTSTPTPTLTRDLVIDTESKGSVATIDHTKELPETGLPLAAALLAGLFPAGLGLKKFAVSYRNQIGQPNYLWQTREFCRE